MKYFPITGLLAIVLFTASCGKSTYEITAPAPTLAVNMLQDTYVVDEPAYLQLQASQLGYAGAFQLSAIITEGECDMVMNGEQLSTTGEWISLKNTTEVLTITPRKTGQLRISFEVKTGDAVSSGRSTINLKVQASSTLQFEVTYPASCPVKDAAKITVTVTKKGFGGVIPLKFEQLSNKGTMQYGSMSIPSGGTVSIPANSPQTLYYNTSERGVHRLQLTVTDGYTTEYRTLDIIFTNE